MFKGTLLIDDVELFSFSHQKEQIVSDALSERVGLKDVFNCRTIIAEVCDKCGKSLDETGECPDQCPEQEFCAGLCGAKHDIDDATGWDDDGNSPWYCDDCKDEQIDAIRSSNETDAYHAKKFRGW